MSKKLTGNMNIDIFGDKQLKEQLHYLARKGQRNAVGRAFRFHLNTNIRSKMYHVFGGEDNSPQNQSGITRAAFASAPVRAGKAKRGMIRVGLVMPSRADLIIDEDDPHFYPSALQHGQKPGKRRSVGVRPYPFATTIIDKHRHEHIALLGKRIGAEITREAMASARKVVG